VADYDGGLRVVDVSDPANPTELGFYDAPGHAYGVYVSGSTAYVAHYDGGLRVVDVSDPANPTEVGYYDTPGNAEGVYVSGSTAYLAGAYRGLRVVDVSDPANPAEVGYYDTPGNAEGVYVSGSTAYVADYDGGLRVVDVSDPANPTGVGYYGTPGWATGVYVSGSYAYVADGGGGLIILRYTKAPTCDHPLTGVFLSGPSSGETGETLTFTAMVSPATATMPITYTWSRDGLVSGQGTHSASYRWDEAGDYDVTIEASNCGGSESDTLVIEVGKKYIYLPVVMRDVSAP
jgi:hypothetical protein